MVALFPGGSVFVTSRERFLVFDSASVAGHRPFPHGQVDSSRLYLTWFYGGHGANGVQREYRVSDALEEKQQNSDQDVLLCVRNAPQDIRIGPVTVVQPAGVGWATATATRADGSPTSCTAHVELDSHPIGLYDVACGS